ncbi:MAG TPA: hypothetical protein VGK36_10160 [Candidatus Angelobacter sp.]|jgi:hypothetical protein
MRSLRYPYRRWLKTVFLFFVWFGIVPLLVFASYYALTTHIDFDPALSQLRTEAPSRNSLEWAIRVGSTSAHWSGIAFVSTSVGLNVVNDEQGQRRHIQVATGQGLDATYRATYLAKFRGSAFPVVMTAFRDVRSDGRVSYDIEINGLRPARFYFLWIAMCSIVAVIFFELVGVAEKNKKLRATRVSQSQNIPNV